MKNRYIFPSVFFSLFAFITAFITGAFAADHNEAPAVMGEVRSFVDITDVFAFKSPQDDSKLVLVYGVFSPEVASTPPLFSDLARYELYVDTDGDVVADTTVRITFDTTVGSDGGVSQTFRMTGVPGGGAISGPVSNGSEAVVTTSGDVNAFAGLRDDHFFFDAIGFQNFLASPCVPVVGLRCEGGGSPENFFGSFNTATIVVEFPIAALPGISASDSGNISIWAKSFEQQ